MKPFVSKKNKGKSFENFGVFLQSEGVDFFIRSKIRNIAPYGSSLVLPNKCFDEYWTYRIWNHFARSLWTLTNSICINSNARHMVKMLHTNKTINTGWKILAKPKDLMNGNHWYLIILWRFQAATENSRITQTLSLLNEIEWIQRTVHSVSLCQTRSIRF